MVDYIRFGGETDEPILVEVDVTEISAPPDGVQKAGLRDFLNEKAGSVAIAETAFPDAMASAIERVAGSLEKAVARLDAPPTEVEVTFGLKATGEVGNIAIGRAGAQANFEIRLAWARSAISQQGQP
jgi:hypothetical protein